MQQLSLFEKYVEELPDIEDVTIAWLHNHINMLYPQFAFAVTKSFADGKDKITQTISKDIDLSVSIGKFVNRVACIDRLPYIDLFYGKNYGDYEHSSHFYTSTSEFLEDLKIAITKCTQYLTEKN